MSKPHWAYYLPNPGIPTLNLGDNIAWKRNRIAYMEDQIAYERTLLEKMEEEFMEYASTGKDCWTSKEISDAKIAFVKDTSTVTEPSVTERSRSIEVPKSENHINTQAN